MKFAISLVLAVSTVAFSSGALAMMNPNGSMMQTEQFDNARKLVEAKKYNESVDALKAVLREFPAHADAWNLLGFSSRMLGDFDKANEYYDNALTITPAHTGALNYKGQMFVQTGRLDQARDMLSKINSACGTDCDAYKQLSQAIESGKAGNY